MPRPKQRTPELRERVLETAIDLLASSGIAGLTTRTVAKHANTSPPAIYELFGDKPGLVRAIFLEGFFRLHVTFKNVPRTDDPLADALALVRSFRAFALRFPDLVDVMFSRPFAEFRPGPSDLKSAAAIHDEVIGRIERCIEAKVVEGDSADIVHAIMALAQGLAAAECARRLGSTAESIDRRWDHAIAALLQGFRPDPGL